MLVPAAAVRRWIASDETFRAFVFETMAARLVDVMTLASELCISRMDVRLAALLLRLAERHPSDRTIEATHNELAAELGTAREVVSRLLKELERAGALVLGRRHVTVTDSRALREIADSTRITVP